jgi:putative ABC transport system permease protein
VTHLVDRLRFEFRMAWRETRPALRKFAFMAVAIALGVGALTGIKGFSRALERAMSRTARDLIASDLSVRMNFVPPGEEPAVFTELVNRGAQMTRVVETMSMASAAGAAQPVLSNVKAVDPAVYPFYGELQLDPPVPLSRAITADAAVATREFLVRTGASVGDSVELGSARFRLAAVLTAEPDRIASGIDFGPRILISLEGLRRAQLIQFGSRATESFLFRLPPSGLSLADARAILRAQLPRRTRISDYVDPNPSVSEGLERTANFLSLIGLLALLVAGLGVATTIHAYLQQKLDTIGIIKCLGGRSSQVIRTYVIQGLGLAITGSLAGVALGYAIQLLFPPLLQGLLSLPATVDLAPGAAVQGFLVGTLTTLLFLLPPLFEIRTVKPARIFLREYAPPRPWTLAGRRADPVPLLATVLLVAGIGALASWLAESWTGGFGFVAALGGAMLVLALAARLLLFVLRILPRPPWLAVHHGLKNLRRPGSHTTSVLVSLGLGVAFVLTVYFLQTSLLAQIVKSAPSDFPNLFLLGITERDKMPLWEMLRNTPGVLDVGTPIPAVPARLQRVDGMTADQLGLQGHDRHYFQMEFTLTWAEPVPPDTRIISGDWWRPPFRAPRISVSQHAAETLSVRVGSTLEFRSGANRILGTVANIRDSEFPRPGTSNQFIFSPGSFDGVPTSYVGGLRIDPSHVARIQRDIFGLFPNVTSIDVGEVLGKVQELIDRVTNVIRFIALFAILCGIVVLASSVAGTRYQRVREAALMKTLGATRAQVARIHAAEFAVVGAAAGIVGGAVAALAAHYLLGHALNTVFRFRWLPLATGALLSAALAVVTGWLANRGVLDQKPLEVLRENQ